LKEEFEEKMKRNAIVFECEAQHTLRLFLQDYLVKNVNNSNLSLKFEIADALNYFINHKKMEFRFSDIKAAKAKEKPTNNIKSTYSGEMYYSSLKDVAGTWSMANMQLVEEPEPYFFVLSNFALF
jgi:hypothetical protein